MNGAPAPRSGAPADGYTILMGASGPLAINASLFSKLPYDPARDFAPVVLSASVPLVLVTHPSLPVKNGQSRYTVAYANVKECLT